MLLKKGFAPWTKLFHSNIAILYEIVIKSIFSKWCLTYFQYSMSLPQSNIANARMQNSKFDQLPETEDTEENTGSFCRLYITGHSQTRLVNYFIWWTITFTNTGGLST